MTVAASENGTTQLRTRKPAVNFVLTGYPDSHRLENRTGGTPIRVCSSASVRHLKEFGDDLQIPDEKGAQNDAIREGSQRETGFRPTLLL